MNAFAERRDGASARSETGFSRAFWIPVGIAFVALQLTLFWIEWWPAPRRLWGDEILYADAAERMAIGLPGEIELLWPAFYARVLAPFARLGPLLGHGAGAGRVAVQLAQLALLLTAGMSLRGLVRQISGSPRAADAACALVLLDPQISAFALYLWPEVLHLACLLGAIWLLVAKRDRWPAAVGAGALLGIALLAKSVLLPFIPVLALPLVADSGARRGLARFALVSVTAAAVVAPTVLENGRRHGVYAVADSSRFNLWVGLNDHSRRDIADDIVENEYPIWRASAPDFASRDALLQKKIARLVREHGLIRVLADQLSRQYFRLFDKDSFFTNQLPGGAIGTQGYGYAAVPPLLAMLLRAWAYAIHGLVLVLACGGLAIAGSAAARVSFRGHPAWIALALAWVGYTLLLFLGLHVKTRYRVQMWPVFDAFAGAAIAWLAARGSGAPESHWSAPSPLAGAGALFAGLLLMFLSFGGPLLR